MIQTIEQLLEQLELWVNFTNHETKQTFKAGLRIVYSTTSQKWIVGYDRRMNEAKFNNHPEHFGVGSTVAEALQDKINKENL